jgi:hypothetical protein
VQPRSTACWKNGLRAFSITTSARHALKPPPPLLITWRFGCTSSSAELQIPSILFQMRGLLGITASPRLRHFDRRLLRTRITSQLFFQSRSLPLRSTCYTEPYGSLLSSIQGLCFQKFVSKRGRGVSTSSKPPRPLPLRGSGISSSDSATPTDFSKLDVFGNIPQPGGSIESCLNDGFTFSTGLTVTGTGVLIIGGEVFRWFPVGDESSGNSPYSSAPRMLNSSGQWEVEGNSFGVLDVVWPKPGTFRQMFFVGVD